MKFMRKPVLVKKGAETADPKARRGAGGLPPQQRAGNRASASQSGQTSSTNADSGRPHMPIVGSNKKSAMTRQNSISQVAKYRQIGERQIGERSPNGKDEAKVPGTPGVAQGDGLLEDFAI